MTRYADDARERVRDAIDMVELVSARVALSRRGHDDWWGCCPFHDERSASFHVRAGEKLYKCFGCGAGGDAFNYVMETEGVGFKEALELLAERFRVVIEPVDEDPQAAARRARRDRLLELLERATGFYERHLWDAREAEAARAYLLGRGLVEDTLRAFRVGYAPSAWDKLLLATRAAGYSEEELLAAGLMQRSRQGGLFDPFRGRIIFPLADERGHVRGFGARAMREEQGPKYRNSREGELFHKGAQLFGIDRARRAAARAGSIVLAEGYTDVLALHQAGVMHAVAAMGTALTDDQAGALARLAKIVVLALDADTAGEAAALRAAEIAEARGLELRVVPLAEGSDPADLLAAEGAEALRERVEHSIPLVSFRVDRVLARADTASPEGRDGAVAALRPLLAGLPPSALRNDLVQRVAGALELDATLFAAALTQTPVPATAAAAAGRGDGGAGGGPAAPRGADPMGAQPETERVFLAACLAFPERAVGELAHLSPDEHFTSGLTRRAARHLAAHPTGPLEAAAGDEELHDYLSGLRSVADRGGLTSRLLQPARMQLEILQLGRAIAAAVRGEGGDASALASRRESKRRELDDLLGEGDGAG